MFGLSKSVTLLSLPGPSPPFGGAPIFGRIAPTVQAGHTADSPGQAKEGCGLEVRPELRAKWCLPGVVPGQLVRWGDGPGGGLAQLGIGRQEGGLVLAPARN
jgi:hypothetical protein